jgi:hypothetical protein
MGLIAQDKGSDFKPIPQGAHTARCSRVIDLGTHDRIWQGQPKGAARKVMIAWELYGEDDEGLPLLQEDGKRLSIAKRYTLSLAKKATLRGDLEAWRGRSFNDDELAGFDLQKLLGTAALINVTHNERDGSIYSNVASISPLPKPMRASLPKAEAPQQFFDVTEPDMRLFETFSEKLKETIRACHEWRKVKANTAAASSSRDAGAQDDPDADIPF